MQREELHRLVEARLALANQRYTAARRLVVDTMADLARPVTAPEVVAAAPSVPQSSLYRTLAVLVDAGVAVKVPGPDDHGRVELAEHLTGHHHHLVCEGCGAVTDVHGTDDFELALAEAIAAIAATGFTVTGHRLDLVGRCGSCSGPNGVGR